MIRKLRQSTYMLMIALGISLSLSSLSTVRAQDLSRIQVDEMTDAQVRQFMQQVQATGMSNAQLEQIAAARGMSQAEIQKLRQRVDRLEGKSVDGSQNSTSSTSSGRNVPSSNASGRPVPASSTGAVTSGSTLPDGTTAQAPMLSDYQLFRPLMPKIF